MADTSREIISKNQKTENIKGYLRWAALFLGELRDGLTMVRFFVLFFETCARKKCATKMPRYNHRILLIS
jgi:hypothetical protein